MTAIPMLVSFFSEILGSMSKCRPTVKDFKQARRKELIRNLRYIDESGLTEKRRGAVYVPE